MLKKAKKTQEIEHYDKVKELNKEIKLVVKKEKKRLVKNKLKNSSPQGFWRAVNQLMGCNQDED